MTGKHRKPHLGTGRKVAATAAVLGAGALPIIAAGSAFAAADPVPLSALPLGGVAPQSALSGQVLPVSGMLSGATTSGLDTGPMVDGIAPPAQERDAATSGQYAAGAHELAGKATGVAKKVAAAVPVGGVLHRVAPAMIGQPAPMEDGVVPAIPDAVAAQGIVVANNLAERAQPVAEHLKQRHGVPTVGDATTAVSRSKLPIAGNSVGSVTETVPVSEMVGDESPVIGTIEAVSDL
jgi:hypothetical protein